MRMQKSTYLRRTAWLAKNQDGPRTGKPLVQVWNRGFPEPNRISAGCSAERHYKCNSLKCSCDCHREVA